MTPKQQLFCVEYLGWSFGQWNFHLQVLRLEGESDGDLERRAYWRGECAGFDIYSVDPSRAKE